MLREFPLPPRASERLAQDGAPRHPPPPVRDAATVMLRAGTPPAVWRCSRSGGCPGWRSPPGMLVFPGGSVDPRSTAGTAVPPTPPPEDAAALAAAVRETFEECGVLLAVDADGAAPDAATLAAPAWEDRRVRLAAGELTLPGVLRGEGLAVRAATCSAVGALGHARRSRTARFDTRFYVAALPAGQEARDLGGEGERAAWLSPRRRGRGACRGRAADAAADPGLPRGARRRTGRRRAARDPACAAAGLALGGAAVPPATSCSGSTWTGAAAGSRADGHDGADRPW